MSKRSTRRDSKSRANNNDYDVDIDYEIEDDYDLIGGELNCGENQYVKSGYRRRGYTRQDTGTRVRPTYVDEACVSYPGTKQQTGGELDCEEDQYYRRGYNRRGYTRQDTGTRVRPTYVDEACINYPGTRGQTGGELNCGEDEYYRRGYNREGYSRRGYVRQDTGTYVQPAEIPPTYVDEACIRYPGSRQTGGASGCGEDEYLRSGHSRQGYSRRGYVRQDTGTYVHPTEVPPTYVEESCVKYPDRSQRGGQRDNGQCGPDEHWREGYSYTREGTEGPIVVPGQCISDPGSRYGNNEEYDNQSRSNNRQSRDNYDRQSRDNYDRQSRDNYDDQSRSNNRQSRDNYDRQSRDNYDRQSRDNYDDQSRSANDRYLSQYGGKNCPEGQIERSGYYRKSGTYVEPTCIADRGQPGKGPKTLPKPDNLYHLSDYGYHFNRPEKTRRAALRDASKEYGTRYVYKRLNLIRNLQTKGTEKHRRASKDVDYMKDLFRKQKSKSLKGGDYEKKTSY